MSVFAYPILPSLMPYAAGDAPGKTTTEHENPSTSSLPASLSKLSLSLTTPIRRYFSNSNQSTASVPASTLSTANNSSSASFSTVSSTETPEQDGGRDGEPALALPAPTYSPIKSAPKKVAGPVYEPVDDAVEELSRRPHTPAKKSPLKNSITSTYEPHNYGYVAESWAGSKSHVEKLAAEENEKDDDDSCFCAKWWVVPGNSTLPWVAAYVF